MVSFSDRGVYTYKSINKMKEKITRSTIPYIFFILTKLYHILFRKENFAIFESSSEHRRFISLFGTARGNKGTWAWAAGADCGFEFHGWAGRLASPRLVPPHVPACRCCSAS